MKRFKHEFIKQRFEEVGYKLLSKEYKNNKSKLNVECSEGHQYYVTYSNFQQGRKCPICVSKILANKQKISYDQISNIFKQYDYKLLVEKYTNNHTTLLVECSEGHQYYVTYSNFQQGHRCPICYDLETYSQSEKDCLEIVKQLTNENIIENDRTQIINPRTNQNLELDIWIPSLKKAIEFNGEYWHSNNYSKYKDRQKIIKCNEKGIDLLVIKYQDWVDNREEQRKRLQQFIGESHV
jgi:ribosomal protein S27E